VSINNNSDTLIRNPSV